LTSGRCGLGRCCDRWSDRSRGAGLSGTNSARTTVTSRGASIPKRTCPPSSRTTVTQMSSPMKSFSMSLRVSTSMSGFLYKTSRCTFSPAVTSSTSTSRSFREEGLNSSLGHVLANRRRPVEIGSFLTPPRRVRSVDAAGAADTAGSQCPWRVRLRIEITPKRQTVFTRLGTV
jgi:hypothetical protein